MDNMATKQAAKLIPAAVQRMTRQRTAIINMLLHSDDHPTAEEIHAAVKKQLPDISIGTVYRNLQILLAEGMISEISLGRSGSRFDANQKPHSHFFCQVCGRVYDVPSYEAPIPSALQEKMPGRLHFQKTDFFGVCSDCLNRQVND